MHSPAMMTFVRAKVENNLIDRPPEKNVRRATKRKALHDEKNSTGVRASECGGGRPEVQPPPLFPPLFPRKPVFASAAASPFVPVQLGVALSSKDLAKLRKVSM